MRELFYKKGVGRVLLKIKSFCEILKKYPKGGGEGPSPPSSSVRLYTFRMNSNTRKNDGPIRERINKDAFHLLLAELAECKTEVLICHN